MSDSLNNADAVKQYSMYVVLITLSIVILLFNYPDVFMSKTLFLDDYDRYVRGLENRVHEYIIDRNFARAYIVFVLYKLLTVDVVLARFVLVAVFYIPLAFSFFLLLRVYAKLPVYVALFASLLPCILPGQVEIPRFIDGSYTLIGLLVYIALLWSSFRYLKSEVNSTRWLVLSAFSSLLAVEIMDQAVFMLPVSIAAFYFIATGDDKWKKFFIVSAITAIVCIGKAIIIFVEPSSTSVPSIPTWERFIHRSGAFWQYVMPYANNSSSPADALRLFVSFLLVFVPGFIVATKANKVILIICMVWAFSSSIPFLTISEYYSSRYLHIAGFGINAAIIISIWQLYSRFISEKHSKKVFIITAVALSLYSGVARIDSVYTIIRPLNNMQTSIDKTLNNYNFPPKAQIVILEKYRSPTHGWWRYSVGYMRYTTKRDDITGQFGKERNFYKPFSETSRYFLPEHRMSGLDINLPVFIFRQTCDEYCEHEQMEYALNWDNEGWNLYQFDMSNGSLTREYAGKGFVGYQDLIKAENIEQAKVAFGSGKPE